MGTAKNQLMANEAYFDKAKEILLELHIIALCDKHPDNSYFYCTNKYAFDNNALFGTATKILQKEYPDMDDYTTFKNQISEVLKLADASNHCPVCAAVKND